MNWICFDLHNPRIKDQLFCALLSSLFSVDQQPLKMASSS